MKKTMKILSVVMALAMLLSVAILPVNAAPTSGVSVEMELAPAVGVKDSSGQLSEDHNIYALTLTLSAPEKRVSSLYLDVNYDSTKFQPAMGTSTGKMMWAKPARDGGDVAAARLGQMLDKNAYYMDGTVEPDPSMNDFAECWGPSNSTMASYRFTFMKKPGLDRVLWNYKPANFSLQLGMTTEAVAVVYFKLLPGQTADGAVFSFGDGGANGAKSVGYDATPVANKFWVQGTSHPTNIVDLSTIGTPDYTYHEGAEVTSPLTRSQILVKQNTAHAADGFDLKVRSTISKDAMNALANNDIKANIKSLGFVVTDAASVDQAFVKDMLAKGLVEAKDSQGKTYKLGTTQALYDDGSANYQFGAVLTAAKSACPLTFNAFVQTADVNNTIFYAADETLTVDKIPF